MLADHSVSPFFKHLGLAWAWAGLKSLFLREPAARLPFYPSPSTQLLRPRQAQSVRALPCTLITRPWRPPLSNPSPVDLPGDETLLAHAIKVRFTID